VLVQLVALVLLTPAAVFVQSQLRNRVFHKITRRGRVLKVVREHYLRDDIGCGAAACQLCSHFPIGIGEEVAQLSSTPYRGQYLVLDTNAVLHQMDLLEDDCDALRDVIVLQTVMEEVSSVDARAAVAVCSSRCIRHLLLSLHACTRFATATCRCTIGC
jgi:hypothetical protein